MKTTFLVLAYRLTLAGALGLYVLAALQGWEFEVNENKRQLPADVRSSNDALRGFHFWPIVLTSYRGTGSSSGSFSGGK